MTITPTVGIYGAYALLGQEDPSLLEDPRIPVFIGDRARRGGGPGGGAGGGGGRGAPPQFYTVPAQREITVADVMMASVVGQYGRAVKFDFAPWSSVHAWVILTTKRPAFYPPRGMKVKPTD